MKAAIVWICAVASLCGSIDGSVLRQDESKNSQIVEDVTDPVLGSNDDYLDNKTEGNFEEAREENPVETTTKYKYKQPLDPNVNRYRSTTRRTVKQDQALAKILKKATQTFGPRPGHSTRDEPIEPKPETTTEYKYKGLLEPYTIPQTKHIPMRHVAGTHYVKVERGQNENDRVKEDYNRLFNRDSGSVQPDHSAPPKF